MSRRGKRVLGRVWRYFFSLPFLSGIQTTFFSSSKHAILRTDLTSREGKKSSLDGIPSLMSESAERMGLCNRAINYPRRFVQGSVYHYLGVITGHQAGFKAELL